MSIVANSANTYNTIGQREELSDIISNITPTDTPLQKMIGKGKVENRYFEWQTDSLTAATFGSGALEGEASITASFTPTVRLGNYCMIRQVAANVTGSEEAIKKAGRGKSEMAYQMAKKAKELKRFIESELINNGTYNAGNSSTARQTRGLYGWLDVNANVSGAGSCALANQAFSSGVVTIGDGTTAVPAGSASKAASNNYAPVAGTGRSFTEGLITSVMQSVYLNGGNPDVIMLSPAHRATLSTFAGGATMYTDKAEKTIVATVSVYESDFGTLKVVPNRFIDTATNSKTVYILQTDDLKVNYLRDSVIEDLAKTGDYESKMLLSEFGLHVGNVSAHGTIRDLT